MKRNILFALLGCALVFAAAQLLISKAAVDYPATAFLSQNQATPTPSTKAEDSQYLVEVKQKLAGHEDEPAETFFKNIEILKGKKASRLPAMMSALTGLLGVGCSYCHVPNEWAREDKPTKQTARKMFRMIGRINKEDFEGKNAVSCWTCHRGNPHPPIQ